MTERHRFTVVARDWLALRDIIDRADGIGFALRHVAPIADIAPALRVEFISDRSIDFWRVLLADHFINGETAQLAELDYPDHWPDPHILRINPAA